MTLNKNTGSQPSSAVEVQSANDLLEHYENYIQGIPVGLENETRGNSAYNWHRHSMKVLRDLLSTPTPPSAEQTKPKRITEQELREIVSSFNKWFARMDIAVPGLIDDFNKLVFPIYLRDEGNTLLVKINNDREPEIKPARISEQDLRVIFEQIGFTEKMFYEWLNMRGGLALLAKLNEHREPDYKADKERLDWMITKGAFISWGRDGEKCAVYSRADDEFNETNRLNHNQSFREPREAIDHAIGLSQAIAKASASTDSGVE